LIDFNESKCCDQVSTVWSPDNIYINAEYQCKTSGNGPNAHLPSLGRNLFLMKMKCT